MLTRKKWKPPPIPWSSLRNTVLTALLPVPTASGSTVMIGAGAGGYRSQYETSTACENPQVLWRYGRTRAMADGWQMLHSEPQRKTPGLSGSRGKRSVSVCRHRGIAPEFRRTHLVYSHACHQISPVDSINSELMEHLKFPPKY